MLDFFPSLIPAPPINSLTDVRISVPLFRREWHSVQAVTQYFTAYHSGSKLLDFRERIAYRIWNGANHFSIYIKGVIVLGFDEYDLIPLVGLAPPWRSNPDSRFVLPIEMKQYFVIRRSCRSIYEHPFVRFPGTFRFCNKTDVLVRAKIRPKCDCKICVIEFEMLIISRVHPSGSIKG